MGRLERPIISADTGISNQTRGPHSYYKAASLQASTISQNIVKSGFVSVPVMSAELHVVGLQFRQLMVDDRLVDKRSGVNFPPALL